MNECPDTCAEAALYWHKFGLDVIPLDPGTKCTARKWQPFLNHATEASIAQHWKRNPDHEVGAIVDDRWIVLDADNEAQRAKLIEIEDALDVQPNFIVRTRKGEHHWFKRAAGTYARTVAFKTESNPDKIDIKTGRTSTDGRSMVVLPPSTNKEIILLEADSADELVEVDQTFIDAVFKHNGLEPPREIERDAPALSEPPKHAGEVLEILGHVDPACGYDQWRNVLMGLHHKFNGSDEGLAIAIEWSSKASNASPAEEVEYKWRSFGSSDEKITWDSICFYAKQAGADLSEIAKGYNPDGTPILTFDELIEAAKALTPESDNIEEVVQGAAHLGPVQKRKIHQTIKTKTGIPLGILKDQERSGAEGGGPPDDLDIARQLIDEIGANNLLSTDAFVYAWKGTGVWTKQSDLAVRKWVQHFIGDGTKVEKVNKSNVDSIATLLRTEILKPDQQFDIGPPECVNVLNGELVLIDGQWILQPHCREHYRTTQLAIKFDASATAPQFVRFLHQVFKDDSDREEKVQSVLELVGYTLMAHCRHERFVILVGTGANGKSVLLYVLERLCGRANVAGVQPSQFDNKFQRAHLHGKLANIVSELRQGAVIDDDALKGITSGETTTVEHKHKPPFDMRPFSTCWFGTNHLPHTRDFSDALFRRALVIEFNQVFKPELGNCDPMLKEKLVEELPGILNLALEAYANAISNGFTLPASCQSAREKWRLEADQVAQFAEECCHQIGGAEEPVARLYTAYRYWASESGVQHKLGKPSFGDRLERLGGKRFRQAGTGNRMMRGFQVKEDAIVPEV